MVKFLDRPAPPQSFGDKLMHGLGMATQSIPDMLIGYNKTKDMDRAADYLGLKDEQKKAFLGLPSEMQSKVLPSLISEANKRKATTEKIPLSSAKHLKEFYPSLYDNPEAKRKISEIAQRLYGEGISETEAYEKAVQEYRSPKQKSPITGKEHQEIGEQPEGWRDFLGKILTESQQTPAPEHPMTTLERERPGGTLASAGLGAVAPIEEALRYQSAPAKQFMEQLGFTYPEQKQLPVVTRELRERLQKGLSPEAIKAAGGAELIGGLLPIEGLFSGLNLIGKGKGFLKNAEKIAAREGIGVAEAMQNIAKEAETAGIDLAKAAAGDKQEAGKLFNLSNRISSKAPATATEMRIARTKPEARIHPRLEKIELREAQTKAFPKYESEIAQDAAERAARAEKRIPKTVKGKESQRLRIHEAEKQYPKAQESYNKASGRVRALEDEVARLKGPQQESAKTILELAKKDLDEATFGLKQAYENLTGVNVREGIPAMREAAQKKILGIQDAISAGEDYKIAKMDYSPDLIKKAKEITKKKPLPKARESDFYTQVHDVYANEYKKRLDQINTEIKNLPKNMQGLSRGRELQLEKNVLDKMIESANAEKVIQNRRFGLREIAERHKAQERFSKLKPKSAEPKVQKVIQENIKDNIKSYLESPSVENLAKVAAETHIPEKAVKQGKSLVDALKEVNTAASKGIEPKVGKIREEFEKFKSAMKARDFKELAANPFSRGLGQIIADYVLNETDLLDTVDLPGGITAISTVAAGGKGRNPFIRNGVVLFYRLAMNNYKIGNYVKAVKEGDDSKVSRLSKEYPRKLIKKAQERLSAA